MPGKGDFGQPGDKGRYYPGDKDWKAWSEGYDYRYGGTAAQRPAGNNPYLGNSSKPVEATAWNDGWNTADTNTAGLGRMPASRGVAPT